MKAGASKRIPIYSFKTIVHMSENHLATIKPSRAKYLNYYLATVLIFALSIYLNTVYIFNRTFFLVVYGLCLVLLALPEILRHRNYHKITDRNIIEIKNFGQNKRSVLHNFVLDIHVRQNPIMKSFFNIGTLKIEAFSGHGMVMSHIKNPGQIAKMIQNLIVSNQKQRQ